MNIGSLLVALAIVIAVLPFVLEPLLRKPAKNALSLSTANGNDPTEEHRAVLLALRDLDFDYQLGQVTEEDYKLLRAQLVAQAARFLQQQEQVSDERIEALIRARRQARAQHGECLECGHGLSGEDRFCPRCGTPVPQPCPECGHSLSPEDRFCSRCGYALEPETEKSLL